MKSIIAIMAALMLTGCMGTDKYYEAQINYYKAQTAALAAYNFAQNNRQPLAEMTTPDGSAKFTVYQSQPLPPPVVKTTRNPIVESLKTVVNSTPLAIVAGGWTAKELIKNATGDITASDNASVSTTSNSHNPATIRNADGDITEDLSDNSNHSDNSNNSDNSVIDSHDQTAEPTIVTQPEYNDPVVLRPEVIMPGGE